MIHSLFFVFTWYAIATSTPNNIFFQVRQLEKNIYLIVKKASKKLCSLRILCRAGVAQDNILKVYLSTVRPVTEYDDGRLFQTIYLM